MKLLAMLFVALLSIPLAATAQNTAQKPVQTPPPAPISATVHAGETPGQPGTAARYIIGPEDSIQVNVRNEPSSSGTFPVRPDGMISIGLVGDVVASGRTPMDLAADLTERLKKFINDPTVTVTVLAVNSKRIFMLGEIQKIGAIPLTSDLTPLQAISAAGGLTPYAKSTQIYILRVENGKQKKIPFNYKKAIKDGNLQGVVLLPGDTIVVP
jgi:polysaccharide export outer membrane protein